MPDAPNPTWVLVRFTYPDPNAEGWQPDSVDTMYPTYGPFAMKGDAIEAIKRLPDPSWTHRRSDQHRRI